MSDDNIGDFLYQINIEIDSGNLNEAIEILNKVKKKDIETNRCYSEIEFS